MKTISNSVKNAFKTPTTKRKGVILLNGNYYDIYNVEYNADCYDEGNVIGNAIASQLDFDIPYMSKFNTFQYFDCIWVEDHYEYIDYGIFNVFDEYDQDTFNKHITAFDNLIKFNLPFVDKKNYPKTLYNELANVCSQAGVELGNSSIPNGNFIVANNQFVNGESLKTVLKQICSISGNYAIVKNNILYLQLKNTTSEVITKNQHEPVDWKRRSYGINQVIIGDSQIEGEYVIREDSEDIALNGVHKLEILDNLFAYTQDKRNALVDNLFNQVRGFGYIPFETKGEWLSYLEVGDTINLDGTDTILLRINAKSPDSLNTTISAPAIIDSSLKYKDNTNDVNNRLKRTEISVDKQNQKIESVISSTAEQNTKISQITQTVDEINSKIQDIADISVSGETTLGSMSLTNVLSSIPILIKIHPMLENIDYLYPSDSLFPSTTLYPKIKTLRFINTRTNEIFNYEIPTGLLIYDSETYDELYISGDSETCQVIKRCKYNNDGTVGVLEEEQTITYPFPYNELNLTDGDYTIQLLGYSSAYMYIRLLAETLYTTMYPTKIEMKSEINQTKTDIALEVDEKLADYSTTTEMNSAINIKANEITSSVSETYATKTTTNSLSSRIKQTAKSIELTTTDNTTSAGITIRLKNEDGTQIDSKSANITLSGKVAFEDLKQSGRTEINGANIITGSVTANKIAANAITTDKINASAITAEKIANATITNAKLVNSTITGSKIADSTITGGKIANSTITGGKIADATITGAKIAGGTITGAKIQDSTIGSSKISVSNLSSINSNLGSITGGSINIGNYFSVNSNGLSQISNSVGFLSMKLSTHPYASGLNVSFRSGGIMLTNGTGQSSVGTNKGQLTADNNGNLILRGDVGTNIQDTVRIYSNYLHVGSLSIGERYINNDSGGQIAIDEDIALFPSGGHYVYAGSVSASGRVLTNGGSPSTLNIKENIVEKDISDIPNILRQLKLYDYNYIKDIEEGKKDYGYIIDYLEEIDGIDKYLEFMENEINGHKVKQVSYERLIKLLLASVINLQKEIDNLGGKINNE